MSINRALIEEAVRALRVQSVLLRTSTIRADDALLPPSSLSTPVVAQHRSGPTGTFEVAEAQVEGGESSTIIVFHFSAGVRLVDQQQMVSAKNKKGRKVEVSEDAIRLRIEAEFGAHYLLKPGTDLELLKPALDEFDRCNVAVHVWPYWREFVQSTCARIGIPAIPIAMLSLVPASSASPKS